MKTALRLGLLLVGAVGFLPGSAGAAAPSNPWRLVPAPPTQSIYGDTLFGVSAFSKGCAWAVGSNGHGVLIEHWNGTRWKTQLSDASEGELVIVAAINNHDVWAVGRAARRRQGLIYRYGGTRWYVMAKLPYELAASHLFSVSASAPDNVWVMTESSELWRWNGASWTLEFDPAGIVAGNGSATVRAVSPTDVWATGAVIDYKTDTFAPVAMHWDGSTVTVTNLPNPNPSHQVNIPWAITTQPSGAPWVTGDGGAMPYGARETASGWKFAAPSGQGLAYASPGAIAAQVSNDVWVAGIQTRTPEGVERVYLGHWNGSTWRRYLGPNPGSQQNVLRAATAIPGTDGFWAVGNYLNQNSGLSHGFILHCCS